MKQALSILLLAAAMLPLGLAKADDSKFTMTASSYLEQNAIILKIKFQDQASHGGVCPYYVKNFSYDSVKKDLSLEVVKDFCVNDQYGKSQGVSYWLVPKTLVGVKLCVTMNQSPVGSIVIEENRKNYRIGEKCE